MHVEMRNHALARRGPLPVISGSAVVRLNGVGTFEFTVDANTDEWRRFMPGWGVIINDGTGRVMSGPVTKIVDTLASDGSRSMKISGVSDEFLLQSMFTLPTPSRAADQQDVDGYYKASGPAETVMRDMVDRLRGGAARPEYRIGDLVIPASQGRGATVTVNTRFKLLIEEMQSLATVGKLNFRVDQDGKNRVVSFFEGRDLSRAVRLTVPAGAIDSYELTREAPTVTEVVVAGQGQGAERSMLRLTGNESEWGLHIARFQDRRDTDDDAELRQAGEETLADGQEKASMSFDVHDVPGRAFLEDFDRGDIITARADTGVQVTDVVQAAEMSWDQTGRQVKLQVGPVQDESNAPAWVKPVHNMSRRLRGLEGV